MSGIRSQATPVRDELAEKVFDLLVTAESMGEQRRNVIAHGIAMGLDDAGWSKLRTISTEAELDEYGWLTIIREEPRDEFGVEPPAIWEFAFQAGWARAGQMFNPEDQTPVLPVTVIYTPKDDS